MAERLGCFDLTDQIPRAKYLFLAHVMTYGTGEDLAVVKAHFSDLEFLEALQNAPGGVFDRYPWAYWNTVLGRVPVQPLPKREFLQHLEAETRQDAAGSGKLKTKDREANHG